MTPDETSGKNYHSKFVECREKLETTVARLRQSELETAKLSQELHAARGLLNASRSETTVAIQHAESNEQSYSSVLAHLTDQLEAAKAERQAVVSRLAELHAADEEWKVHAATLESSLLEAKSQVEAQRDVNIS